MPKKILKETVKDIGTFTAGSLMLGAGSVAVGSFGGNYGAGLATASSMMPAVGSVMMMKPLVGLSAHSMKYLPKTKRHKRHR